MKVSKKAFTLTANGIVTRLITDCHISEAIDIDESPNVNLENCPTYKALWDTGATISMIDKRVSDELGLIPHNIGKIYHANGEDTTNYHKVSIFLPNRTFYPNQNVAEGKLSGCDVLIGMDIISKGDFSVTNKDGKTIFSFQTPSTHLFDFVQEINMDEKYKVIHNEWIKHGNHKCPCGSGKLYKNCHGKQQKTT